MQQKVELNKHYGCLTPFKKVRLKHYTEYMCRCTCGNIVKISGGRLLNAEHKYCAKCRPHKYSAPDISGKTFGEIKVLEKIEEHGKKSLYKCRCSCGNEFTASYDNLIHHHTKTCGHLVQDVFKKGRAQLREGYIDGTSVNALTRKLSSANKSGHKGVCWDKNAQRWVATIGFKKTKYHLGKFKDIKDAIKARECAEEKLFGNFLDWYYNENPEKKE
jgi:hypothetical protein